jgi:hypothetical protein
MHPGAFASCRFLDFSISPQIAVVALGLAVASLDEINARLLATLRIERVPVVGFVNERSVDVEGERDARTAILKRWLDARMELGNHTYSHPDLNSMSADEYQIDILQGELVTRKLLTERG